MHNAPANDPQNRMQATDAMTRENGGRVSIILLKRSNKTSIGNLRTPQLLGSYLQSVALAFGMLTYSSFLPTVRLMYEEQTLSPSGSSFLANFPSFSTSLFRIAAFRSRLSCQVCCLPLRKTQISWSEIWAAHSSIAKHGIRPSTQPSPAAFC